MKPFPWVVSLVCLLAFQAVFADLPRASRSRAARMDLWRTQLAEAERAVAEGREREAEALYREVIEQAAGTRDPGLLAARALDGLADLCRREDRLDEARELYSRSAGMWERLLGPRQPRLAVTLHNLGVVETARGEYVAADEHLLRALSIWEEAYGADSAQAENTRRARRRLQRRMEEDAAAGGAVNRPQAGEPPRSPGPDTVPHPG